MVFHVYTNDIVVNLVIGIVIDAYSWFLLSLHWIPHHNTHDYDTIRVLGKVDEKKEFHAKRWITIGRVYKIKRP